MSKGRARLEFLSEQPPAEALGSLRACFHQTDLPPLRLSSLQPFPRGRFFLGDFRQQSMSLRVVNPTVPLRPTFEGELLSEEGASRLVGTLHYDCSGVAIVWLVLAHVLGLVLLLLWTISGSVVATSVGTVCVVVWMGWRIRSLLREQESQLVEAIGTTGFRLVETTAEGTTPTRVGVP